MTQYLISASDGTDEKALERRMAARPSHIEYIKKLKESGNFVLGGAKLSESNTMNGSSLIVQFETDEELQNYLSQEPYITNNVWASYTVEPFKVAEV